MTTSRPLHEAFQEQQVQATDNCHVPAPGPLYNLSLGPGCSVCKYLQDLFRHLQVFALTSPYSEADPGNRLCPCSSVHAHVNVCAHVCICVQAMACMYQIQLNSAVGTRSAL